VSRAFNDLNYQKFNLITTLDHDLVNQAIKTKICDLINVVPSRALEYLSLQTLDKFGINFSDHIKKTMRGVATKYLSLYANISEFILTGKNIVYQKYEKIVTWLNILR
jgi:hypothetical protein